MSIPTELPNRQLPPQQHTDQFLSNLRPGEVLSARVTGQASSGATLLSIAGRQIAVQMQVPPIIGTLLTLEVSPHQAGQQGVQFNILGQRQPPQQTAPPPVAQAASQASANAAPPQGAAPSSAAPASPSQTTQAGAPASAAAQSAGTPGAANASSIPPLRVVPQIPGGPATVSTLQAGAQVDARVVARPAPNLAMISVQGRSVLVTAPPQLAVGTQLGLTVQQNGAYMQFSVRSMQVPAMNAGAASLAGMSASTATGSASPAAPMTYSPPAPTAQAVAPLTAAMRTSVATQNSLQPLFQTLSTIGAQSEAMPAPVREAIGRVMQAIPNMRESEQLTGAVLREAISRSGLQMESLMARLPQAQPELQNDLKALLLLLRGSLRQWLGDVPLPPMTTRATPPLKGQMPRAPSLSSPGIPADAEPETIGKTLLGQTESALSRIRVMQLNALPDTPQAQASQINRAEMQFEIPFIFAGQMTTVHLQVQGDAGGQEENTYRRWKMRFALALDALGEVGGEVGLDGGAINVSMWALEPDSSGALQENIGELVESLEALGLNVGIVKVRERPPHTPPAPNGTHLVDSLT